MPVHSLNFKLPGRPAADVVTACPAATFYCKSVPAGFLGQYSTLRQALLRILLLTHWKLPKLVSKGGSSSELYILAVKCCACRHAASWLASVSSQRQRTDDRLNCTRALGKIDMGR